MTKEEAEKILNHKDPIADLRSLLNREFISRDKFHKMVNVVKVMPEFLKIAMKKINE